MNTRTIYWKSLAEVKCGPNGQRVEGKGEWVRNYPQRRVGGGFNIRVVGFLKPGEN